MEEGKIIFYILLIGNAIYLVENIICTKNVKSTLVYTYCDESRCDGHRIVEKVISCSNISISDVVSHARLEVDGRASIILKVTDSDIALLPSSVFKNIWKLTILYLENSNTQKIIPGAFNFLNNLKELYLDGNQLTTISDGLFNSLTSLEKLDLSRNQIQDISDHAFRGVNLKELLLSHNNISQIGQVLLDSLTSLKTLDISWNNLNNITSFNNTQISTLDLSHNGIDIVDFEFFPEQLFKINLSFNCLSEIINFNASRASEIMLNHNNIIYLEENVNSVVLDVSYNELETVDSNLFGSNLIKFNASYNSISSLNKDAFLGLHNLEYLLLNSNNLSSIPNSCFKDLELLTHLDLSRNELSHFAFGTFENLLNLKVLNISYNKLKDLQQYTFYSLGNLTDLLFQNNEISDIHVDDLVVHTSKLKIVNLDNNNWSCEKLLHILHSLKKVGVSFPKGSCRDESSIHGIKCHEILNKTALDESSKSDNDLDDSKLNRFFNEEFTKSKMYKYFNQDFKDSNFFQYLENLNNTISNDQNLNTSYFEEFMNELKSNYSDAYKDRLEQSAMFNYFNDDFRKSNFFKYLESLKNQATIDNKLIGSKLEDLIVSLKEIVEKNSMLNNSFRQDFSKSDMYKYFNQDFKNSNFLKYLENLNERVAVQKYVENLNGSKNEKYINSFEDGKISSYNPNYTGLLLFISTMLVIIVCAVTITLYLFISSTKKYSPRKIEDVQLL